LYQQIVIKEKNNWPFFSTAIKYCEKKKPNGWGEKNDPNYLYFSRKDVVN